MTHKICANCMYAIRITFVKKGSPRFCLNCVESCPVDIRQNKRELSKYVQKAANLVNPQYSCINFCPNEPGNYLKDLNS